MQKKRCLTIRMEWQAPLRERLLSRFSTCLPCIVDHSNHELPPPLDSRNIQWLFIQQHVFTLSVTQHRTKAPGTFQAPQAGRGEPDRAAPVHTETKDPRWPPPAAVPTPLACGVVLCVAAMEAAIADPLGILRGQLPGLCTTRIHHHATQTILR